MGLASSYDRGAVDGEQEQSREHGIGSHANLPYVIALTALPLILLALNDNWLFSPPGWIDPWVYTGYHLHLFDLSRAFPNVYYETRLPWNLLGWIVHESVGPTTSLYALRLILFYISTFSLFFATELIFRNAFGGFISACLLGTNSWFLWAIGWDYVDGPSLACLLASIGALAGVTHGMRWRLAALLWGVMTALMVTVYIMMVVFLPIEFIVLFLLNRMSRRRSLPSIALLFVAGTAGAMLAMGLANLWLGSNFFYLVPQITIIPSVSANRFDYVIPLANWVWSAPWMLVPAIVTLASSVFIAAQASHSCRRLIFPSVAAPTEDEIKAFILALACCLAALGFIAMEAMQYYVLQIFYRANALLPFSFLAIGAFFSIATMHSPRHHRLAFAFLALGLSLTPWMLDEVDMSILSGHIEAASYLTTTPSLMPAAYQVVTGPLMEMIWIIAGAGFLLGLTRLRGLLPSTLTVCFMTVLGVASASSDNPASLPFNSVNKDATLAVFSASDTIGKYNRDVRSRLWYSSQDRYVRIFTSVASTYLYAYNLINSDFPHLTSAQGRLSSVAAGDRLIIMSSSGDAALLGVSATLSSQNVGFSVVAQQHIQSGSVGFDLVIVDVSNRVSG